MTGLPSERAQPIPKGPPADEGRARWRLACIVLGLYLVVLVVAALTLPHIGGRTEADPAKLGLRLALCLLAIESVALAVGAPFLAACFHRDDGSTAPMLGAVVPVLAVLVISLVVLGVVARGAVRWNVLAWSQLFLLAFAFVLIGLTAFLAGLGARPTTAQLGATIVALAMLGNVFFANALVEAARAEGAKMLVIDAVLWSNPWLIVGGSILEADPLRSERLYSWSVIIYYGFRYPGAGTSSVAARSLLPAAAYAGCGVALWGAAWLAARLRRRRPTPGAIEAPKACGQGRPSE